MSIIKIKDIEDALIAAVKAGMPYLRRVDTYQGELDEEAIAQFVLNFPAVMIYMEKNKITNRSWPLKWQHPRWTFLLCEKNLRGNKAARQGDGAHPGIYQMLDDLFATIYQKTFDLEIDPFDIPEDTDEEALINSPRISVYAVQYFTKARKN